MLRDEYMYMFLVDNLSGDLNGIVLKGSSYNLEILWVIPKILIALITEYYITVQWGSE